MKIELDKLIRGNNKISYKLMNVRYADSLSENQLVAWVKGYCNEKNR